MLVKIAELMEQTSNPTVLAALKCAWLEQYNLTAKKLGLPESQCPEMTKIEISYGLNDGKLAAVREYKNRTQLSLMDAKRAVEYQFDRMGYKFK